VYFKGINFLLFIVRSKWKAIRCCGRYAEILTLTLRLPCEGLNRYSEQFSKMLLGTYISGLEGYLSILDRRARISIVIIVVFFSVIIKRDAKFVGKCIPGPKHQTEPIGVAVTLCTCIWDVSGLNLTEICHWMRWVWRAACIKIMWNGYIILAGKFQGRFRSPGTDVRILTLILEKGMEMWAKLNWLRTGWKVEFYEHGDRRFGFIKKGSSWSDVWLLTMQIRSCIMYVYS
jgi:hypothetical protein